MWGCTAVTLGKDWPHRIYLLSHNVLAYRHKVLETQESPVAHLQDQHTSMMDTIRPEESEISRSE